jgi:hypothetical protein
MTGYLKYSAPNKVKAHAAEIHSIYTKVIQPCLDFVSRKCSPNANMSEIMLHIIHLFDCLLLAFKDIKLVGQAMARQNIKILRSKVLPRSNQSGIKNVVKMAVDESHKLKGLDGEKLPAK